MTERVPPPLPQDLEARRAGILDRIAAAARRSGRDPAGVTLVAVTKTHSADLVRAAARAGHKVFGENRVSEGAGKIEAVRGEFPGLAWRLIGPLQTNKAGPALQYFSAVETLDRQRLVERLERLLSEENRRPFPVLLEVNLAREATKSGVPPEDLEALAGAALGAPHLDVRGLMAVPPFEEDPERTRRYFRQLRELRDRLVERLETPLPELSMGMSHDFDIAIEEGSTEVRVGTALFGARSQP